MRRSKYIVMLSVYQIDPSPENEKIYDPPREDDPAMKAFAEQIKDQGILVPLEVSLDHWITSGHRRHKAAQMIGLTKVPCIIWRGRRGMGEKASKAFQQRLAWHNQQRVKTHEEQFREAIVLKDDNEESPDKLMAYRKRKSKVKVEAIELRDTRGRSKISKAKFPFLDAVRDIVEKLSSFWPLSDRLL